MAKLKASQSFAAHGRVFPRGVVVDSSDPVVAGRESLFAPVESATSEPPVEQATAAPGEQRAVKRPARTRKPKS